MTLDPFCNDYSSARTAFRNAGIAAGWTLEAHAIDAPGPAGEPLTIDVALSPRTSNDATLIVSSGLHGVEGFFGSALQVALLRDLAARVARARRPRLVLVHALNPFGFAWLRRVNEQNVDLNRNFLTDGEIYRGSPEGYAALDSLLNPATAPGRSSAFYVEALMRIARHGMPALKQAIAAGQYDYPKGLFFGGHSSSPTKQVLATNLPQWIDGSKRVVHLDIHTGLGPWATYRLLPDVPLTNDQRRALTMWCNRREWVEPRSDEAHYSIRGGLGSWVAHRFDRDYVLLVAEFGTYHALRVLAGLRAENQEHHFASADSVVTARAKARLRELFYPHDRRWRRDCLTQGLDLIHRAIAALSEKAHD